jgi:hypothetical protein
MRLARRRRRLDGGSINRAPVDSFMGYSGRFRERWEDMRQPLACAQGMVVSLVLQCGYKVYTSAEFWKLEVPRDGPLMVVPTFYTHGSVIMELDDDMKYICWSPLCCNKLNYANILIMNHEHAIIWNAIAFLQMYKCLITPLHPSNIICWN